MNDKDVRTVILPLLVLAATVLLKPFVYISARLCSKIYFHE